MRKRNTLSNTLPLIFISFFFVFYTVRVFKFINTYSVDIPYTDQWYYLPVTWDGSSVIEKFVLQVGPHRQGLAFVIDSITLALTSWNIRAIAFTSGTYFVLAALAALILKRRVFGEYHYSDVVIPMLFLSLSQFEMLTFDPFPAYGPFPLLLLMLYLLSWLNKDTKTKYILVLLFNFLLTFSAFGLVVCVSTLINLLIDVYTHIKNDQRVRGVIIALLFYVLTIGAFLVNYDYSANAAGCFMFPHPRPFDYLLYQSLLFANSVGFGSWIPTVFNYYVGFSFIFLAFYIFIKSLWQQLRQKTVVALAISNLILYSMVFSILLPIGRVCLGVTQSQSSRYLTYMVPFMLGLYFFVLTFKNTKTKLFLLALFILIVFRTELVVLSNNTNGYIDNAANKKEWVRCILEEGRLDYCSEKIKDLSLYWGDDMKQVILQDLRFLEKNKYSLYRDKK